MKALTFGSLFAGVEGFGLGFERAGMKCVWQVERDSSCLSVLERHWPGMKRVTDVRDVSTDELVRPDWICGGFPCQDLSVAGRRAGLAGERSGLFFEFVRILREFAPSGFVIENVPGLLSSWAGDTPSSLGIEAGPGREMDLDETSDFGTVLDAVAELGYGAAVRVLDAQWFRVAQRRRRVFVVGCLGDWRRPCEILFERESLPWDSPPSREAGARVAASLTRGTESNGKGGYAGRRREDDVNLALCLNGKNGKNGKRYDAESESFVTGTLNSGGNSGGFRTEPGEHLVTHSLRAEGADASGDGTGRGTPLVTAYRASGNCGVMEQGDRTAALNTATDPNQNIVSFHSCFSNQNIDQDGTSGTLASHARAVANSQAVRPLTPRECERLQGFPDDWTRYGADGKEISDSARYRMLGNAVAVPVSEWIARRIVASATACE